MLIGCIDGGGGRGTLKGERGRGRLYLVVNHLDDIRKGHVFLLHFLSQYHEIGFGEESHFEGGVGGLSAHETHEIVVLLGRGTCGDVTRLLSCNGYHRIDIVRLM